MTYRAKKNDPEMTKWEEVRYDFIAKTLFDQPLYKRVFKKVRIWEQFLLYVLLVIDGIRDGYLIDGVDISSDDATTLLNDICLSLNCPSSQVLMAIHMGDNIFVIRSDRWEVRREQLSTSIRWESEHPVGIDVNGKEPLLCSAHTMEEIRLCLIDELNPTLAHMVRFTSERFHTTVGFAFLVGWLLGYPFVYLSIHDQNNALGSTALSMIPLFKISIHRGCALYWTMLNINGPYRPDSVDIYEFTVPISILNLPMINGPWSHHRGEESTYDSCLKQWTIDKQRQLEMEAHANDSTSLSLSSAGMKAQRVMHSITA